MRGGAGAGGEGERVRDRDIDSVLCFEQLRRHGLLQEEPGAEAGHGPDPERILQPQRPGPVQRRDQHAVQT